MPTLKEYFDNDFKDLCLESVVTMILTILDDDKNIVRQETIEIKQKIRQDFNSSTRFFTYYIPTSSDTLNIIIEIINQLPNQINAANNTQAIGSFTGDVQVGTHKMIYSSRIYFYTETLMTKDEINSLDRFCKSKDIYATIRSSDYLEIKSTTEKAIAFISHDSRDKELIAKRLADGLNSRICMVWYDEYTLKIGDSLRESIEKGIKEAKKCILILTKNYLTNPGWGKKEFNSIFTREMIMNERIVLPIWHNVTKEEVYEYSPSLADTVALKWPNLESKTEKEYSQEVEQLISKIHTAITTKTLPN